MYFSTNCLSTDSVKREGYLVKVVQVVPKGIRDSPRDICNCDSFGVFDKKKKIVEETDFSNLVSLGMLSLPGDDTILHPVIFY